MNQPAAPQTSTPITTDVTTATFEATLPHVTSAPREVGRVVLVVRRPQVDELAGPALPARGDARVVHEPAQLEVGDEAGDGQHLIGRPRSQQTAVQLPAQDQPHRIGAEHPAETGRRDAIVLDQHLGRDGDVGEQHRPVQRSSQGADRNTGEQHGRD